ncbi:MAG: aminotransferase class V-fold PLP-dependent enzyme, partial [Alphaproteobacteria bacterium]
MKENFPIYKRYPNLVYLDTAATALKPQRMIEAISKFYATQSGAVHRGNYPLANEASQLYEDARKEIADFIKVPKNKLIFTSGATEGINLIALALKPKTVLSCESEHHSNLLPWIKYSEMIFTPTNPETYIDLDFLEKTVREKKIDLVAISGLSNVLGEKIPLKKIIEIAHRYGTKVLVDGTQLICHEANLDLEEMGCDYFVFSGHKLYGPTGIGGLYIRTPENMISPKVGGGMIESVFRDSFTALPCPHGWEAGTPAIAQAIGLAESIRWLKEINWKTYLEKEDKLIQKFKDKILDLDVTFLGRSEKSMVSCFFEGVNADDLAMTLGAKNIAVRAGKHCT